MFVALTMVRLNREVTRLVFGPGEYLLGRSPECQVRIGLNNRQGVSRQHCLLRVTEHAATIRDLCSSWGTVVSCELIKQDRALRSGDQIRLGRIVLHVEFPERAKCDNAVLCRSFQEDNEKTLNVPDAQTNIGDTQAG